MDKFGDDFGADLINLGCADVQDQSIPTPVIIEQLLRYPGPENRLFPVLWPRVLQKLFYHDRCQDTLIKMGSMGCIWSNLNAPGAQFS